ncbi:hypothetical protein SD37_26855 [Amycolatopsis orientalis]|uniref:HTH cro/C1-type domain-containing protein n=1 Tax=Amycolatopsis orientalis TaxID=31958 RepID=A0A193C2X6_AMYOR|nr:helix-turn-helix domain-containing protein [Amycolatopsis orientalis]ANN18886.1 hypothetical protein SD37_26855 [Amycolatopsis orientalis]
MNRFAAELRRLRRANDLSLSALSTLTHYSKSYLSNVENERKPPSADLARRLDEVLGARGTLLELADVASESACPYRGLVAFEPEHARWFFGRERLTAELVARLASSPDGMPLAVFGASGAGKSSLLKAGLVPSIARGALPAAGSASWPVLLLTPTARPAQALAQGVAKTLGASEADLREAIDQGTFGQALRVALGTGGTRLVLVVDQFEEIFTLCESETERESVIKALCGADTPTVLGVRADFYPHCLAYPELLAIVTRNQFAVGAMTREEVVDTITRPAEKAKLTVEPGLVELLLRDLGITEAGYEPGALPLLSHALLTTWQQRDGDRLTVAGYELTGGINRAVAETAERVYTQLDETAREVARRLLLRLVRVGDEGWDTRRRADRESLLEQDAALVAMEAFAAARLLVLDRTTVEITHEALLRAWPRLRGWLDADRAGLRVRQRLTEAAETWDQHERATSLAYRGTVLAGARSWASAHRDEVTALERDFLAASEREEHKGVRRLRRLVVALSVFVVLTTIAGGVAIVQRQQALTERDQATSRQAGERAAALLATDPSLAGQLALAAYRIADTAAARGALLSTFADPYPTRLHGGGDQLDTLALRADGNLLVTGGGDGLIQLWDGEHAEPTSTLPNAGRVAGLAISPDGRLLATAASGGVSLWDVADPARPERLAPLQPGARAVRFSPDGKTLVTAATAEQPTRLWNVSDPRHPAESTALRGHDGEVNTVEFSQTAPLLVTGGEDGQVIAWDTRDSRPQVIAKLGSPVSGLTLSRDGRTLALADETHSLWLCAVDGTQIGAPASFPGPDALVRGMAFTRDGTRLAVGANDGVIRFMDVASRRELSRLTQPNRVRALAFSEDDSVLATASSAGRSYLWHLPVSNRAGHDSPLQTVSLDAGSGLVATTARQDARVLLWRTDWSGLAPMSTLSGHAEDVERTVFGPGARLLATSSRDRTVRLWDLADPTRPVALGVLRGFVDTATAVAWSPDGRTLATGDDNGDLMLWDVTDPRSPVKLATLTDNFRDVNAVAFSADGKQLASGNSDRTVRLWDLADRAKPRQVAKLSGFTEAVMGVAFSSDAGRLAAASLDHTARLWNLADRSEPATIAGHAGPLGYVAFSPDDRTLVTTSTDRDTRLWDVTDPRHPALTATLQSPRAAVTNLVFLPDGRRIAAETGEHVIRFWNTDIEVAARRICELSGTPITRQEWAEQFGDYAYSPPCA